MTLWVGIQFAWRKQFPEAGKDPDVLANRGGCHGCTHEEQCEVKEQQTAENIDPNSCDHKSKF